MQNPELALSSGNSDFTKITAIANTKLTPTRIKKFRQSKQLSQQQFANLFRWSSMQKPYTRNYISMLERGKMPITREFEKNFYRVRQELRRQPLPPENVAVEAEVVAKFALPRRLEILAKPRRCKGCRRWFVPVTPNQKMHNTSECKNAVRRTRRKPKRK